MRVDSSVYTSAVRPELMPDSSADGDTTDTTATANTNAYPLVRVRDIPEIVEQDWLVENLIPRFGDDGAAGYVFGPEKSRKSMWLCEVGVCVASGQPVMGRFEVKKPGTVVGFFAEDPKGETARRVNRIARGKGIEVPDNFYLLDVPAIQVDNPLSQQRLLDSLLGIDDLSLVFLDPMVRLHTANDNRAEELGPIHSFLRSVSRRLPQAVVLLAHHTNKGGGYRGSTDYGAFGDFNLHLSKPDDVTTSIDKIENRGGPPGEGFRYTIEDSLEPSGPALRLVIEERDPVEADAETTGNVEQLIWTHLQTHPDQKYKEARDILRRTGLKFGNSLFADAWKGCRG